MLVIWIPHLKTLSLRTQLLCCEKLDTRPDMYTQSSQRTQLVAFMEYQPRHQTCEKEAYGKFSFSVVRIPPATDVFWLEAWISRKYKPSLLGPLGIIHPQSLWAELKWCLFNTTKFVVAIYKATGNQVSIPGSAPGHGMKQELNEILWNWAEMEAKHMERLFAPLRQTSSFSSSRKEWLSVSCCTLYLLYKVFSYHLA